MTDTPPTIAPSDIGAVARPPCHPPIEIIERDAEWYVREYRIKQREATVFETHDGRLDAMRAARERMESDRHPCLLRWDADDIVGDIYWNELFERLHIEYSTLLDRWVVVPAEGHYVFQSGETLDEVGTAARAVQRQYNYKQLVAYDRAGTERETRDHRFVRHDITASGVRFDRGRPLGAIERPTDSPTSEADSASEGGGVSAATPTSTLMAAIPNLTQLEELTTSGPVYRYRVTWTNGQLARIALLNPTHVSDRPVVERFTRIIDDWQSISDETRVATVFEIGPSPAAWIAYEAADGSVRDRVQELSLEEVLGIITDVARAIETAQRYDIHRTEITPDTVRLVDRREQARAVLAGWGLERAVASHLSDTLVTPYTAPEQLRDEITPTTAVYQLGALAYRLLCHMAPFTNADDLGRAIRNGALTPPSSLGDLPSSVDSVIRRAMAPVPDQRYPRATLLSDNLESILD